MMSHGQLKERAAQKEKEWRDLQEQQVQSLEASLKMSRQELKEEKEKLQELKEHFKYNLKLIGDRDAELERYDALFLELKTVSQKKDEEVSELKMKLDELQVALGKEAKAREEMQLHYQQRLREKQGEIEQYRSAKDAEINKEREGLETVRHALDRRVIDLEGELETQRRELTADFEEASRKKEHEYRLQADKLSAAVLGHELKVKLLTKELEMLKTAQESSGREAEQAETVQRDLEKQLRQKDWELEDVKAMSSARIAELESKLKQSENIAKKQLDDFQRRFADADRLAKEKEAALAKVRESADCRENQLRGELQKMTVKLEESAIRIRQLEWNAQDAKKKKVPTATLR